MALDLGVFCKSTLDGEAVEHCFSSIFGLGQNADPSYLDWLLKAWGWTLAVAGLGLAIVKHIATRHQAQLLIESMPGKGSTFTLRFPKERLAP